jgi:hypothetical protein
MPTAQEHIESSDGIITMDNNYNNNNNSTADASLTTIENIVDCARFAELNEIINHIENHIITSFNLSKSNHHMNSDANADADADCMSLLRLFREYATLFFTNHNLNDKSSPTTSDNHVSTSSSTSATANIMQDNNSTNNNSKSIMDLILKMQEMANNLKSITKEILTETSSAANNSSSTTETSTITTNGYVMMDENGNENEISGNERTKTLVASQQKIIESIHSLSIQLLSLFPFPPNQLLSNNSSQYNNSFAKFSPLFATLSPLISALAPSMGYTALHASAANNDLLTTLFFLPILVSKGPDLLNTRTASDASTPLHWASLNGVRILLIFF